MPGPAFQPHRLFLGGHLQTLAGHFIPGRRAEHGAHRHVVDLPDGDRLLIHDDAPAEWNHPRPVALLLHGLAGCHQSPYIVRIAQKLNRAGVRTFRMDHRGAGAGMGLARLPYHAGRSGDVAAALEQIARICPRSPLGVAGFSLSGNMLLKLLGEGRHALPPQLDRAVAVNPPIDLRACANRIEQFPSRLYNRHLVGLLFRRLKKDGVMTARAPLKHSRRKPRTLRQFDDLYTAPVSGFESVDDYYERTSSSQFIPGIRTPTWILAAADDPMVPVGPFETLSGSPSVRLTIAPSGGHLGYIGRAGIDPDCRWMDWRVVEWLTAETVPNARELLTASQPA